MLNTARPGQTNGDPAANRRPTGADLDPDDPNRFGPDAPNVREDDPPGGQVIPETPPPRPPAPPLDHGDFAPDEA
jgi:hypothetical protein